MPGYRTGSIYVEQQAHHFVRGVGWVKRDRWCAEITVNGKRYRKRAGDYATVRFWLDQMLLRFPTYDTAPRKKHSETTNRMSSICYVSNKGEGRNGRNGSARINFQKFDM